MNNHIIETTNLHKSFRKKHVLKGVDLQIPRGSVVGLLGKNGAGKTTLIKCILGLLRLSDGKAVILNEDPWDLSAKAKEKLGFVPQELELQPWMKVRQIVDYTASFYPHWNMDLADRLLAEWELDETDAVGILSVGQKQKLGIILALGHEPELLILDEPVASLDPIGRRSFLKTILDITSNRECTVLFSTHITSDLERVADRVAILKEGKIIFHDELDNLKDSVKRLEITSNNPLPKPMGIPGTLREEISGTEAVVSVKDLDESALKETRKRFDAEIIVRDVNLEEIFLELHHA